MGFNLKITLPDSCMNKSNRDSITYQPGIFSIWIFCIIMKDKVWIRVYKKVHINLYKMDDILHTECMFGICCQYLRNCLLIFLFWFWGHHFYLLCSLVWPQIIHFLLLLQGGWDYRYIPPWWNYVCLHTRIPLWII